MHKRIISQDKAISALARHPPLPRWVEEPERPIDRSVLGPTGVGKPKWLAPSQFMFGSDKALVRFDMSEFMEKHSVSKLIGSPPGYVGYEEGGQLTERVKRLPIRSSCWTKSKRRTPMSSTSCCRFLKTAN